MSKTVTVDQDEYGRAIRLTIGVPVVAERVGQVEISTGLWLTGIYIGPKSRKMVIQTYSQWQKNNTGCGTGTEYHIAGSDEAAQWAGEYPEVATIWDKLNPPAILE